MKLVNVLFLQVPPETSQLSVRCQPEYFILAHGDGLLFFLLRASTNEGTTIFDESCCGDEIRTTILGRQKAWITCGIALEHFEKKIMPYVGTIMRNIDRGEADLYMRVYMVGKTKESSTPMIAVICSDVSIGKKAKKALKTSTLMTKDHPSFSFGRFPRPLGHPTPVHPLASNTIPSTNDNHHFDSHGKPVLLSTTAAPVVARPLVLASTTSRYATGGLILYINEKDEYHQLTAGHLESEDEVVEAPEDMDGRLSFASRSFCGDEDDLLDKDSIFSAPEPPAEVTSQAWAMPSKSHEHANSKEFHADSRELVDVGSLAFRSQDDDRSQLDYALSLHVVRLDGPLAYGDSGSIIVDAESGDFYGHITSGCVSAKTASESFLRLALPVAILLFGSILKFRASLEYYFIPTTQEIWVYGQTGVDFPYFPITPFNRSAPSHYAYSPGDLSRYLNDAPNAIEWALDSCVTGCTSYILPGDLSSIRTLATAQEPIIGSALLEGYFNPDTIRITDAPGYVVEFRDLDMKSWHFDLDSDCFVYVTHHAHFVFHNLLIQAFAYQRIYFPGRFRLVCLTSWKANAVDLYLQQNDVFCSNDYRIRYKELEDPGLDPEVDAIAIAD
ncbi:hypothetical protein QBC37DRAFT_463045 [Rhypophila decipiens]|uniref:Uncharacterized protein n=1 Tax=Rhypophila decipiens TaxID=261697 RepID=A0AAN6Y9P0_9PEZI|nr:hypothetical protein QBC37DRAFT_463045 [Rhypophila decipiens]